MVRSRLAGWVDAAAESAADVDVSIGAVDVALLADFPTVRVTLRDVVVDNRAPFEGVELARLPRIELGVDLLSALSGSALTIQEFVADGATVHVVYNRDGRANWDVLGEGEGDPNTAYHLRLSDVTLSNLGVIYEDQGSFLRTEIEDVEMSARADLTQSLAKVQARGSIESLTVRYVGITWLQATKWKTDMRVDYDQETGAVHFGENQVTVNALPLTFSGLVEPRGNDWFVDIDFKATDTSFQSLLSLVPDAYDDNFEGVDAAGSVSLTGSVDGMYRAVGDDLPGFKVELDVAGGRFKFPDLPTGVDRVEARVLFEHPEGPADLTVVDAQHFELTAGGATLAGRMKAEHPMTDPDLDGSFDGRVDLGALRSALPAEAGAPAVDGVLDLDFALRGKISDFKAQRVESVKADGTIRGKDLKFNYEEQPMEVTRLDVGLSPTRTDVNALALRFQGSDVALSGGLDNAIPWAFADGVLGGSVDLVSTRLDLRSLQSEDEADPNAPALVAVPENIDATLGLKIGTLITREFTMEDVSGSIGVANGTVTMSGLRARMYGGRVTLDGTYTAPTVERAQVDVGVAGDRLDVSQTFASIETLKVIAPVLERAQGRFNSGLTVKTTLSRDGTPDLSILSSAGDLVPLGMSLHGGVLDKLASELKSDKLAKLTLDGTRLFYAFQDGRVDVKPFAVKLGPQDATIHGHFGPLDRTLDLAVDLPVDTKALAGSSLLSGLGADLPKTADVRVGIGGTMEKPKLTVSLQNGGALVDAALDPLVLAATEAGDKLLAEARAAAQKLIDQAGKLADGLVDEAGKRAKATRKAAKGNPLKEAAADVAAKVIEKEGDKAAKTARQEAKKAADKLVDEASKKRDKLIADATDKARAKLK